MGYKKEGGYALAASGWRTCPVCRSVDAGTLHRRYPRVGGMNIVSFRQKRGGEHAYLFFFPIFFFAPACFLSVDPTPLHLLVTRRLAFPPFRSRFRCHHSFRWRWGLLLVTAAGRPLLRSGVGHLEGVLWWWCGWWLEVVVGSGCGG